ncbi:hypothetical protein DPMN_093173 [Dreissena polymorpha]|uniref:Uncharacterized protein n=1 Tax=Dreissena polymorpha TaxID=45954 RepID=A0A9D4L2H9_DREPO|nr:hypothetical protein DPMN_093173 [Dreissena polymorpha]
MNPKSYKRYGTKEAFGSNNLKNEMRSWSRNKMEDRKLAMKTTEVDRHAAERRKSFHYETRLVNKDLEENIIKTTPRVEEYLDRNQNR